ncbi:MAG: flavodoxin-dependent (E)-4-hydroxy-3-methylbut-2-enyl-diphosphate synthase [Nitrospiraceae bacterium]|jgi:(E)-4-hydroxy-3-methylbut-2-enyl-diphosphate synthase|nr:flavodoxin-dependent (E)-4-hydroxy-3-methylbut-2-enyl-diphosphate synthase [Nitrospiraceae bacterium]
MIERRMTRQIAVGGLAVGGGAPVSVQSMTKTDTRDVAATVAQIRTLEAAGCEIIRLAVPDEEAALALGTIRKQVTMPMIADIHFDYRLALEAIRQGVAGLRLNPGNIGAEWKVREVVTAAKERGIPIRIGVNAGSLEKHLLEEYGHPTPEAIVESAQGHIRILEDLDFRDIKVSLKASNVMMTVNAYRLFSSRYDYPLHIGITETGPLFPGAVKSAVGLGILLAEGIGDTMRVSLTAPPEEEVRTAYEILRAVGIRQRGAEIVSCPTCGRCQVDLRPVAEEVARVLRSVEKPITVAVMGCVVNGPGEAREADFGIAGGKGMALLFKKGEVVKKIPEDRMLAELVELINGD